MSPDAETEQSNANPAVAVDGQVTVTTSGAPWTLTIAEPEAEAPFPSDTVKLSVFIPFEFSVLLIVPVPVYGIVPPTADTVQSNATPRVAFAGQLTDTTKGWPVIVTLADPVAEAPFPSVTVNDWVKVPLVGRVAL